ncbi:uncharacterized protein PGTG_00427 [Puccinia graminis f. sp. tritici CRL 75-36-700-3]|uniref:Uncharacterized protein n=1 Tax=Puccinia graminis f. sp. tritici (strain CRL 75-36-700-3 / race SCCL) TaxID=418459 RepID=E3JPU2_PUCGT|nr:uncharacterized protein PGTG_00427 [Puccinia graminis f. sp. tritici CRL 75-36-700-3]EFP74471.1 hypothetical protein PGTG_00427 [Puccinia graminis f. sp. tritici CRL 75-36-700-3]
MTPVNWIVVIWLVSSSSTAAPFNHQRRWFWAASKDSEMASRTPALMESSKTTLNAQSASSKGPTLAAMADSKLTSTKPLPKTAKETVMTDAEDPQAKMIPSSQSHIATSKSNPDLADQLKQFRVDGGSKGFINQKKKLAAQVERDGQRAPEVHKPPSPPLESMGHEKEEAKVNEGITKSPETSDSNVPPSSWWPWGVTPSYIYNSAYEMIKPHLEVLTGPSVPESTSQALARVAKPSDSKSTSPTAEISTLEETRQKPPVVNLEHPKTEHELAKEPPLSDIEKKNLAQLELKKLMYGISKPFVSKQLTPGKTSQMVQKWARRKNFMLLNFHSTFCRTTHPPQLS